MKKTQKQIEVEQILLNEYLKSMLDEDDEKLIIVDRVYKLYQNVIHYSQSV